MSEAMWSWELLGGRTLEFDLEVLEPEERVFLQDVSLAFEDLEVGVFDFISRVFSVENPWARETEDGVSLDEAQDDASVRAQVLAVLRDMLERRLQARRAQDEQAREEELVDVARVMGELGVSRNSVYVLRNAGHIVAHKTGGRYTYELSSVLKYGANRVRRGPTPKGASAGREPMELDEEGFIWPTARVCEELDVTTKAAVYAMRDAQYIQARKVGGRWLFHPDDIRAYAAWRRETGS